ncbi:MAG: hypothetical protein V1850_03230 [Candidatus Bathyarchaeota archaeon]
MSSKKALAKFPRQIDTVSEFMTAREALAEGYKHRLRVVGDSEFKKNIEAILDLIRVAGYVEFLRTYIRSMREIEGLSQLREAEAMIWLNDYMVGNPFEGARFVIQKAEQMKGYLDGKRYYNLGEISAVRVSIVFLEKLKSSLNDEAARAQCEEVLRQWKDAKIE